MNNNYNDPLLELKGKYVKRCKCGLRPYYDRIDPCIPSYGCCIKCTCGNTGKAGASKQEAIDNWNNNNLAYEIY